MFTNVSNVLIYNAIGDVFSSVKLWTVIIETFVCIILGYLLTKKKVLGENSGKTLINIVMSICLPCLAFSSFMSDFSLKDGYSAIFNLVFGFFIYILFIFFSKLLFIFVKDKNKKQALVVLFSFGSTTFFSQPIISAIYGTTAYNDSNLLNVAFRVFLYSYAYLSMAGVKPGSDKESSFLPTLKKVVLNPIFLATILGFALWMLQAIPGSYVSSWWTVARNWLGGVEEGYVPFWRIDVTLPWIYQVMKGLGSLSSPLVFLSIGATLASVSLSGAFKDPYAWAYSLLKGFLAPAIVLLILYLTELIAKNCGYPNLVDISTVQSSVIMWLAPAGLMSVAYCINFDKGKLMASNISLLSTIVSVFALLFWVCILGVISLDGFFPL